MAENKRQGITRRGFLKSTALTAGAMAVAGSAGCSSVDTSGEAASEAQSQQEAEATYTGVCRGNCGGECYLQAKVREGKIVSTTPKTYAGDCEGIEQGCVKGMANPLRLYGTHRLLHPMKRAGERGSGQWEQITWDEAIQTIANKMSTAIEEYGPASVCFQVGAGSRQYLSGCPLQTFNAVPAFNMGVGISRLMQKIGATCLTNGDDMAGLYLRYSIMLLPANSLEDMENAKHVIVWGSNPAEASFNRSTWHYICKARENGARITVIDPLYSSTAAHADDWIPIRCGTDTALMCAMANYLIENNLVNEDYMRRKSVSPLLIKAAGEYVRVSDVTGDKVAEEENVPVVWDEATGTMVAYTQAESPALSGIYDLNGEVVRTVYDAMIENIAPFTVEFAAQECGIAEEKILELAKMVGSGEPTWFNVDWGVEHTYNSWKIYFTSALLAALTGSVGVPGGSYSASSVTTSSVLIRPTTQNNAALTLEGAKPVKVITGDYLCEIMETGKWAGEDYPVRVVYSHGSDALDNWSGPADIIKAFEKIDFIVTAEQFMTTTAHYSDIVLPVAMSWETEDWYGNGGFMIQRAIEPLGEAKPDFDIYCMLADAMGYDDLFDKTAEEYLRELLDTPENLEAGTGYDAYREQGAIIGDYVPGAPVMGEEVNPLGLTQYYLENMPPRDDWGQVFDLKDRLPHYEKSKEAYPDNPERAKYPLYGFSSHDNYHGQSVWAHNAWLDNFRTVDGKPFCRISEKAAAERGIATGDKVRVFNDHGNCVLNALVTKGIQEDSVWMPHGFFWDEFEEGFAQMLTGHYPDPVTSNSNFNDWICQVEKCEGGAR